MTKSTVFKTNRTQAVRIPKELAFPEGVKEVDIVRSGAGLLIVPKMSWKEWFDRGPRLSDDFPDDIPDSPPDPVEPF